ERSGDQVESGRGSQGGSRGGQGSGQGSQEDGRDGQKSDQGSQGSSRGNHVNNHRNNRNQDDDVINDNNQGNVRTMNNDGCGCSYKEFMACNPKDYDGNGGAIVYTCWIKKIESTRGQEAAAGMTWEGFKTLTREVLCPNNEMQKLKTEFWCHAMVGAGHAAYTDRFYELARLVPHLVTPENNRIERLLKRGNNKDSSKDGNARNNNKRSRTGRAFSTTTNPVRKEYTGTAPECQNCNYHHQHE
nr:hypothetical protein [Tanacetum cinerariifolium]